MPVTKTAKRALRVSSRKGDLNKLILSKLEIAIKKAKKTKTADSVTEAMSLADRAAKKNVFHTNKANRIKSSLSKLAKLPAKAKKEVKKIASKVTKKTSKKTK